jgi:hypothetical protein
LRQFVGRQRREPPADQTEAAQRALHETGQRALRDIEQAHREPRERKGRNVAAGNLRGWTIEFGNLLDHVRTLPDYQAARAACEGRTLVGEPRLLNLYLIIKFGLPALQGDVIECGTYRGGSALFIASVLKSTGQDRVVYACDTFTGMPETNHDIDMHRPGDFADISPDAIRQRACDLGLDRHMVIVPGLFQDTLPDLCQDRSICLVHVDCDIYDAVRFLMDAMDRSLVSGAYVIFDDPLYSSCLGAMEAVEESYIQQRGLHAEQVYPHMVFRPHGL